MRIKIEDLPKTKKELVLKRLDAIIAEFNSPSAVERARRFERDHCRFTAEDLHRKFTI